MGKEKRASAAATDRAASDRAELLQVRILSSDLTRLRRDARQTGHTLAEWVRLQIGAADPPRGGARPGAGRRA